MAGVQGPCPSCRATITAPPLAADPATVEPDAAPTAPTAPTAPSGTLPPANPPPASPQPRRISRRGESGVRIGLIATPHPATPAEPTTRAILDASTAAPRPMTVAPAVPVDAPRLKSESRPPSAPPGNPPLPNLRSTEDQSLKRSTRIPTHPPRRPTPVFQALVPAVFSALAVIVVYLLLYFFLPFGPAKQLSEANRPLSVAPPAPVSNRKVPATLPTSTRSTTPPAPKQPAAAEPIAEASAEAEESPAVLANQLLDSFLRAPDAASRVGMVEPAVSESELAATLLKAPLPEVAQIFSDLPQHDPAEQRTDYPYRVSFFVPGKPNVDYAVLVRQRGTQAPKVYLPAFLDLAGGRLAEFTTRPNQRPPGVFHVILEPVIGCHEDGVPNPARKFTFKLLSSPFGRETSRAYAANGSRFRRIVEDPTSPIRWGIRGRATITVQWNHAEDPAMPYLELVDINSPDWNP